MNKLLNRRPGKLYPTSTAFCFVLSFFALNTFDSIRVVRTGVAHNRHVRAVIAPSTVLTPPVCVLVLWFCSKYQLVFCYTIIERNNRQMLPVIRTTAGGDSVRTCTNPLDTFFPFDPCVLKRWVLLVPLSVVNLRVVSIGFSHEWGFLVIEWPFVSVYPQLTVSRHVFHGPRVGNTR